MLLASMMGVPFLSGCSNGYDEPNSPEPEKEDPFGKVYYYDGGVSLSRADTGDDVYVIPQPGMFPGAYGFNIPIPLPEYECDLYVKLGEGTIIEKESVRYTIDGQEYREDMPHEGTASYNLEGLSITRNSPDTYTLHLVPSRLVESSYSDIKVMMTPIPIRGIDSAAGKGILFTSENLEELGIPAEIGLQVFPFTYQDFYRPLMQYHLKEAK